MENLNNEEFLKKVEETPTVEPDEWDLKMLSEIDAETDDGTISLEEIQARRCNGKLSVRVPKELHRDLLISAKENGVSLNQFIVYKLAK